jgi:hypothetical protein
LIVWSYLNKLIFYFKYDLVLRLIFINVNYNQLLFYNTPELNPIEQFWSVVKSKMKRNRFLEKETLMTRISEASSDLRLSNFKGIVGHSHKCLDKCRNRQALWRCFIRCHSQHWVRLAWNYIFTSIGNKKPLM